MKKKETDLEKEIRKKLIHKIIRAWQTERFNCFGTGGECGDECSEKGHGMFNCGRMQIAKFTEYLYSLLK